MRKYVGVSKPDQGFFSKMLQSRVEPHHVEMFNCDWEDVIAIYEAFCVIEGFGR